MRHVALFLAGILFGMACSTIPAIRKFTQRRYRPISDIEAKINDVDPTGKLVFRYCKKYRWFSSGNPRRCKYWGYDIKDFCSEEGFRAFRDGGFIMINEDRVK